MNRLREPADRGRLQFSSEAGVGMAELLVFMMLSTLVLGLLVRPMLVGTKVADRESDRAAAIETAEAGLFRMTRELRQAETVYSATASSIDIAVPVGGSKIRVLYKCDFDPGGDTRQCIRSVSSSLSAAPSPLSGTLVIDDVLNGTAAAPSTSVFEYPSGTPTYTRINLVLPASSDPDDSPEASYQHDMTLRGGIYLRNLGIQ